MKTYIKILLTEAFDTLHSIRRFKRRFGKLNSGDITNGESVRIIKNLESVNDYVFTIKQSIGILLGEFNIQLYNSKRHKDVRVINNKYYAVKDGDNISVGNQVWVVVRNNKIITVMFRKNAQDGSEKHLMDVLKVDKIIRVKNFSKYKGDNKPNIVKKRKFKKIKIDGYGEVRYYEDGNEFITNDGTKLDSNEIDDIKDKLPDSIKNKVLGKI